jgi:hypothetical protein
MRRLQLYIGTDRVDLFKDETVSLTQTIQNVKDIAKVFTEFTQTFAVPASKKNNKIFQHYYNFDIDFGFDARNKADARLELNDLPFKNGKIKLNSVDLKNNVAHTYHITFFGNTVNLKDVLGDDLLSSLSSLDNNSQSYDFSSIVDTLQNFPTGYNDIIVPLITHTDRMTYNTNTGDENRGYGNVFPHNDNGINWNQFKYALRIQAIITAIESKYTIANGYGSDIVFSDDFFNDTTNDEFNDLFLWLHRKKGNVETPSFGDAQWTKLTDLRIRNESPDVGGMPPISSVSQGELNIDTSYGDVENFDYKLTLNPTVNTLAYDVRVIGENTGLFIQLTGQLGAITVIDTSLSGATQMPDDTYSIEVRSVGGAITFNTDGVNWRVRWDFRDEDNVTLEGIINYSNLNVYAANTVFEFNITQQIPKIKVIDFLSGLFKMFNLTAYVNDLGIIVVRTLDSYYASGSQTAINIDKYLDTKTSKVNVALPFKQINFSYKGLGTLLAKQFTQIWNTGWGSLGYRDNTRFDAPTETYKVELPFEHMQYERLVDTNPVGTGTATTIQYGFFVDDNFEPYYGEPLLFYPILNNGTAMKIIDADTTATQNISSYFIPSNSLALDCATSKVNIHFQNEFNEYTIQEDGNSTCFTDTLFETKYKTYIQDVFNEKRRLVKVTAYLPMKVYYDLELNDLIQLGQDSYKINSMKTDLTSGKTEFELLNTIL